jgi:subtilisin family serine protease
MVADQDPARDKPLAERQRPLFEKLDLFRAWEITRGDPDVLVGVIDSGFDYFHPDLEGQLLPGYYGCGGHHDTIYENIAHGTAMASLIVAGGADRGGMTGLAPRCRVVTAALGMTQHPLLKLRRAFFRERPDATLADFQGEMNKHRVELEEAGRAWVLYQMRGVTASVAYLVDRGVRVINISGFLRRGLCRSPEAWGELEDAFAHAAGCGVVIVLSAGNSAAHCDDYPGRAETVLVAGGTRLDDSRWEQEEDLGGARIKQGSNYGPRLSVMAPIEDLVVCAPHERRFYASEHGPIGPTEVAFEGAHHVVPIGGTSSAAPIVSALAALVVSARPDADTESVVSLVKHGCADISGHGLDPRTGFGRINYARSLELARDRGSERGLPIATEQKTTIFPGTPSCE